MKRPQKSLLMFALLTSATLAFPVCDPEGNEPAKVVFPVYASGEKLVVATNDQGWSVELSEFKIAVKDLEFTIEGETHEALLNKISDFLVPKAFAHPGHYAGGEVTGELSGRFILNLNKDSLQSLGEATLLEGEYHGFNLYFTSTSAEDEVDSDDPIYGHTAFIEGIASKDESQVNFTAVIDIEEDTQMVGGIFEKTVKSNSEETLTLQILSVDQSEGDTLFDGLDFGALDSDGDALVEILPGEASHNILMKTLQIHDHYNMEIL